MALQETIQRGNKFYLIKQTDDESREVYLSRVNYIIEKLSSDESIDDIIGLSYVWRNVTFHKMTYPSAVMKKL